MVIINGERRRIMQINLLGFTLSQICDPLLTRLAFAQSLIIIDALDLPGLVKSLPSMEK